MSTRSPGLVITAAAFAAVLCVSSVSIAAWAGDASVLSAVDPGPSASASPDPAVVAPGDPAFGDADAGVGAGELADGPPRLTIEAGDLWYAPSELTISSGEPTVLALVGTGQVAHNLIVDELGLGLHVGPGITSEVTVVDLPPGTYQFYCSIYGHQRAGMYGTLVVE